MENTSTTPSPATSTTSDPRTTAILAWLFAPFSSYLFKDEQDALVRSHARESFYLGIANLIALLAVGILNVCIGSAFSAILWNSGLGLLQLMSCLWSVLWLAVAAFIGVPRIVGIVKANNREEWKVPYITDFLSKYIKF